MISDNLRKILIVFVAFEFAFLTLDFPPTEPFRNIGPQTNPKITANFYSGLIGLDETLIIENNGTLHLQYQIYSDKGNVTSTLTDVESFKLNTLVNALSTSRPAHVDFPNNGYGGESAGASMTIEIPRGNQTVIVSAWWNEYAASIPDDLRQLDSYLFDISARIFSDIGRDRYGYPKNT